MSADHKKQTNHEDDQSHNESNAYSLVVQPAA